MAFDSVCQKAVDDVSEVSKPNFLLKGCDLSVAD